MAAATRGGGGGVISPGKGRGAVQGAQQTLGAGTGEALTLLQHKGVQRDSHRSRGGEDIK